LGVPWVVRHLIGRADALEGVSEIRVGRTSLAPGAKGVAQVASCGRFRRRQSCDDDAIAFDDEGLAAISDAAEDIAELAGEGRGGDDGLHNPYYTGLRIMRNYVEGHPRYLIVAVCLISLAAFSPAASAQNLSNQAFQIQYDGSGITSLKRTNDVH